jgi:hypothetical protein
MKRILTFIICICLVLSLCSCTEKGKSKGLDRPNIISFYDNVYDIGEFYMDFQDRICFGDLNSFVSLPICSKPNCLHDSPDCGAVGLPMTAVIIYYEDSLYYFLDTIVQKKGGENEYNCELYKCGLNGENRKKINTLPAGFSADSPEAIILDGSTVYFIAAKPTLENGSVSKNMPYYLCKYDLAIDEFSEIAKLCEGYYSSAVSLGVFDGRIYFRHSSYPEPVENPDKDFWNRIYSCGCYDMKTGEISEVDCIPRCVAEGYLVTVDEAGKLKVTDEDGGIYLPEKMTADEDDYFEIHNGVLFSMEDLIAFDFKSGEYYKVNLKLGESIVKSNHSGYIIRTIDQKSGLREYRKAEKEMLLERSEK